MEYRQTTPADNGFVDESSMVFSQREQIQYTMMSSGSNELLDTLLVVANVCEQRALFSHEFPQRSNWYASLGVLLRSVLEVTTGPTARPDVSLENPALYFPDVEQKH